MTERAIQRIPSPQMEVLLNFVIESQYITQREEY
ncbi:hypothetical protein SAMN06295951_1152 [Pseudomonas panipatensis]|nr:hypothetical protein SAMN06295951_1152 [Pseudomonas panipatensis]